MATKLGQNVIPPLELWLLDFLCASTLFARYKLPQPLTTTCSHSNKYSLIQQSRALFPDTWLNPTEIVSAVSAALSVKPSRRRCLSSGLCFPKACDLICSHYSAAYVTEAHIDRPPRPAPQPPGLQITPLACSSRAALGASRGAFVAFVVDEPCSLKPNCHFPPE